MTGQELQILQGVIAAVVYQNYDNGYAVLRLDTGDGRTVTVVGVVPMASAGERLMVTGKWISHPSYGRQFEAEFLERLMPQTQNEILAYLSGKAVKGIGPVTAARIVRHFGDRTLQIMEQQPELLAQIQGISKEKARAIGEEFRHRVGMRQLMEFLALHQLPAELALRLYKLYRDEAVQMLYDDPYLLTREGLDAPFGAVDRFAIELGISGDAPRRVQAGVVFELRYNLEAGHAFLPEEKLVDATARLLSVSPEAARLAVDALAEEKELVRAVLAQTNVVYLRQLYDAEQAVAAYLTEAAGRHFPAPAELGKWIRMAEKQSGIVYSAQQEAAIRQAVGSGVLLLTGGPGTGKTTILKGVLSVLEQMGLRCVLAAPTGRAAKRLTEVTGAEASTIHRLLETAVDPQTGVMYFARNEHNPLRADAVIVDEMSMVDVLLFKDLLQAVPPGKRLILVGDPDQLPPVGPGFPFGDCLRSGVLPAVRLTEIFRQARESLIVMNAHRVNEGQMPDLRSRDNDFFFLGCNSEEQLRQTVTQLCSTRLPNNMGIPADQIQVLSPTRRGGAGTAALNQMLQGALNSADGAKKECSFGEKLFREGDRVMQIRNNYDIIWKKSDGSAVGTGIFNGDIGTVLSIDRQEQTVRIAFDDREAVYDFDQLGELEMAYAVTVHKSQGSEYKAVILAAWGGSPYLLSRSVLYTAITRARQLLIIVGRQEVVAAMTENAKRGRRYTGLKLRLQGKAD